MNHIDNPGLKLMEEIALTYPKLGGDARVLVQPLPHLDSETEEEEDEGDNDFGLVPN